MTITPYITEYQRHYRIEPLPDRKAGEITVCSSRWGGEFAKAEINWPALGSVSVEVTREFINGLQMAADIADRLNRGEIPQFPKA